MDAHTHARARTHTHTRTRTSHTHLFDCDDLIGNNCSVELSKQLLGLCGCVEACVRGCVEAWERGCACGRACTRGRLCVRVCVGRCRRAGMWVSLTNIPPPSTCNPVGEIIDPRPPVPPAPHSPTYNQPIQNTTTINPTQPYYNPSACYCNQQVLTKF